MVVKFYFDLVSPPVRSVYFTLKYLNLPIEFIRVHLFKGEHKSKEYLKVNPHGRIPSIEDNGLLLYDSHAINIYLVTKYAKDDKLYPSDIVKRAIVNQRLFFETGELFPKLRNITKNIALKGVTSLDEEGIGIFETGYGVLDNYLKQSQYIAGHDLTIADFSIFSTVISMNLYVPVKENKYPLLTQYLKFATTWPHYAAVTETGIKDAKEFLKTFNFTCAL